MGGCFGKRKKNRVSPAPSFEWETNHADDSEDLDARLSRVTPCTPPSRQGQLDMIKDLKPEQAPVVSKGGVAFDVDYRPATPGMRAPSRLLISSIGHNSDKMQYTREERRVMADLLREDILEERRQTASCNMRLENAARRRAVMKAEDKAIKDGIFE